MARMGSGKHAMPPRENARLWLQGVPAEGFSSRPGASGEMSRTRRSVTAHKAAGDKFSCNLGGTTELFRQSSSLCWGGGCFCFGACHKNIASGGGRRKNHEERYSYAMDRFE